MSNEKTGIKGSLVYGQTRELCQVHDNCLFELVKTGELGIRHGDSFFHYGTSNEMLFARDTFYSTQVVEVTPLYVGMGVTKGYGGDRQPATVVKIEGNRIWTTDDTVNHISGNFQQGNVVSTFETNWEAPTTVWSLRHNGYFYRVGQPVGSGSLGLNGRSYYQDPHF